MEFYNFSKDSGKRISKFNSNFIMSRVIQTDNAAHIGCMHLDANGIVGYHQAVVPQLLLVIHGEGYVRNDKEDNIKVQPGDAVFWEKDEWHEKKAEGLMEVIELESVELNPSLFMALKK